MDGISYDVTPGVSSFSGAAAALQAEYTLPDVSQSVIITRMAGRTPVPEGEALRKMASHGCTMGPSSPRACWRRWSGADGGGIRPRHPGGHRLQGHLARGAGVPLTVSTLAETARTNGVTKTALITVGRFLGEDYERSKLYDPTFTHGCRKGIEV